MLSAREDYSTFQKQMRDEVSPTFYMDEALEMREEGGLLIDGLRNFDDYQLFKSVGGITIALWCPLEDRFTRGLKRGSNKDATNIENFKRAEASEYDDPDPRGIHLLRIMQMADYHVDGSKTQQEVSLAVDTIIAELILR